MTNPKVEVLPIEQGATPDPSNVNKHTQRGRGLHENSMRKRGAGRSIFSAGKGTDVPVVMGGNQTLEIAATLGMEVINVHTTGNQIVNVVRDDIAPNSAEFYAMGIEDNEIGKLSYNPDIDILAAVMADPAMQALRDEDKILAGIVEGMGLKGETADAEPQIDRAAELQVKWGTKTGDLWQLGKHRLLIGDCTVRENVERLMGGERAELVFTDPPYRMEAEGGSNQPVGKAARKLGESIKDLVDFDPIAFLSVLPCVFDSSQMNAYIFCNKDLVPDYLNWGLSQGYSFNILFWKKPNAIPLGGSHRPDVEYLLLFRNNATWNNAVGDANYSKCLVYDRDDGEDHPTIKPLGLVENEIKISSSVNGLLFEPFCGSGTTIIAAHNLNRRCYAMEISEKYGAVILERFFGATGITPELEEK